MHKISIERLSLHRKIKNETNRDVAQLVARHVRDVEVGRSSRLIPTKKKTGSQMTIGLFLLNGYIALNGGILCLIVTLPESNNVFFQYQIPTSTDRRASLHPKRRYESCARLVRLSLHR